MLKIGCHLSSSLGYLEMGKTIVKMGGNTFQFFTRNPRGGAAKAIDLDDIRSYNDFALTNHIDYIIAHAPYTLNACSDKDSTREFALETFKDDLMRLEYLDHVYYNFHPGSHVGQGVELGLDLIVKTLNEVLSPHQKTLVLLETMAGKGSEIGRNFEEIKYIIDHVKLNDHLGVTLDTCHIYDGGYDIKDHLDEVLLEFDNIIGIERLKAIHLNDSKNTLGSHKDRHEKIGLGNIGKEALIRITNHPLLKNLPFVLETPNDEDGYIKEIQMLKDNYRD